MAGVAVLVVLGHVVQAGGARVRVAHRDLHVAHRDAADQPGGAEGASQSVRRDVPAAGGLGDAVHHAPSVQRGQRVPRTVQQRSGRSVVHHDADGAHHRYGEGDVGGLAALADELEAVVAAVLAQ